MTEVLLNPTIFRPGSKLENQVPVNFIITRGGLGDYICAMAAIIWIAKNHPQVKGRVYAPDFFREIAEHLLKPFPNWALLKQKPDTTAVNSTPTYFPIDRPINGTGCHLVDIGFIYYTGMNPPPKDGNFYPSFDFKTYPQGNFLKGLGFEYAVMTPGATFETRMLPASAFNGIKNHLISKGIKPVFLGSSTVGERDVIMNPDYDYSGGINLLNKTSLMEAGAIIADALLIVGLDNGLLHLAAMTETPIIFGYNIASPEHREPRRKKGITYNIYPDENYLSCTFCQSKMRFMFNHDFRKCMYKDLECLKQLSDPGPWNKLVDQCLEENP